MLRIRQLPVVAVAIVVAVLLGAGSVSAASHPAPFIVTLSGTSTLTSATSGDLVGSGHAGYMGSTTNVGHVQAHPDEPNGKCPNGFRSTNDETFTVASGDTLSIHSEDVACPQGPGQFLGTGHWVVTGGTGRFSGSAGQGLFAGFVDFAAGTFTIGFAGVIQY